MTRRGRKERAGKSPAPRAGSAGSWSQWIPTAEWVAAILLTVFAVTLHVAHAATAGALWRDEVNSLEYATMPSVRAIYDSLQYDSFPILTTLAIRGWASGGWGGSDEGLRAFGLLVGLAFLASLWVTGRFLTRSTPLLALTLIGVSPWSIRIVDSIRPYGLGAVCIVLTIGLAWKAVESASLRWTVLAGALAALSVHCMYQNAFLVLAIVLAGCVTFARHARWKDALRVALVGGFAAISLLPYASSIAKSRSWGILVQTSVPASVQLSVFSAATGLEGAVKTWLWMALIVLAVAAGAWALTSRRDARGSERDRNVALYGAAFILVSTVVYLVAIQVSRIRPQPWYYVPLLCALAPAAGAVLQLAARGTAWRAGIVALALGVSAWTAIATFRESTKRYTNVDGLAAQLAREVKPGDAVVVYPFYFAVGLHHYYQGSVPLTTIPPIEDLRVHRYDLLKKVMMRTDPIAPVLQIMERALRSGHRVWLVGGLRNPDMNGPPPSIAPAPNSGSGWYVAPYINSWGEQAAYFLTPHVVKNDLVPDPVTEQVSFERVPMLVVSGWH